MTVGEFILGVIGNLVSGMIAWAGIEIATRYFGKKGELIVSRSFVALRPQ